jgi:hypothetical protein
MGTNPRIITEDRLITWDGVVQRLPKGQQIDVPPGSALEREIGAQFLIPLGGTPVPAEGIAPEASPRISDGLNEVIGHLNAAGVLQGELAPARPRTAPRKQGAGTAKEEADE